jgi:hypothetical protein
MPEEVSAAATRSADQARPLHFFFHETGHSARFYIAFTKRLHPPPKSLLNLYTLPATVPNITTKLFGGLMDVIYIGAMLAFFVVSWALAVGCQKLGGMQ